MLSDSEKQVLLNIARQSIEASVSEHEMPKAVITQPALRTHAGAFVTLHEHGELRGCIGYIDPLKPLIDTVQDAAAKAALDDPRFMPVHPNELQHIEIEISVLSPLHEIASVEEIVIGKHGVVVELDNHRGLLLPQVAVEAGWDKQTFLHQTFRKTGLPEHLWHHKDMKISIFTAEVFSEATVGK